MILNLVIKSYEMNVVVMFLIALSITKHLYAIILDRHFFFS